MTTSVYGCRFQEFIFSDVHYFLFKDFNFQIFFLKNLFFEKKKIFFIYVLQYLEGVWDGGGWEKNRKREFSSVKIKKVEKNGYTNE